MGPAGLELERVIVMEVVQEVLVLLAPLPGLPTVLEVIG